MKLSSLLAALVLTLSAGLAIAEDIDEMYKTKNCFACHRIDRHHHAPTFKEIAAKYKRKKGSDVLLAKRVREGSVGVWGQTPMPPQAQVTDEEALKLTRWILKLK